MSGTAHNSNPELPDITALLADAPPGTVLLDDLNATATVRHEGDGTIVLQPQPSSDPNDPLNWSKWRKYLNFSLICFYAMMIFTFIDVITPIFQTYNEVYDITYQQLTNAYAMNGVGLAIGSLIFIPCALKWGRRPIYLLSILVTLLCGVWFAVTHTYADLMGAYFLCGVSGAVSEAMVQMTINDMFFVHERGTMVSIYLACTNVGVFLAPIASGYVAQGQSWQWVWWWCTILLGVTLLLFLFCYEETKFTHRAVLARATVVAHSADGDGLTEKKYDSDIPGEPAHPSLTPQVSQYGNSINHNIPMRSYRQRLPFVTSSPGGFKILSRHVWQPLWISIAFPAVFFAGIQYGHLLSWFSVITTTQAEYFAIAPYNFGPNGIGLLNLGPFIGTVFGNILGGPLSDRAIRFFCRRNNGIFESEMRLYIGILPIFIGPLGVFLYGYTTAKQEAWIIPTIGAALFSFNTAATTALSFTYVADCYSEILGDAFAGITFIRNIIPIIILFTIQPWIEGMGFYNTFTLVGCLNLFFNLLLVPMVYFGRRFRIVRAAAYEHFSATQFNPRSDIK